MKKCISILLSVGMLFLFTTSPTLASYQCQQLSFGASCDAYSQPYAFPGAEGWGASTVSGQATATGGRGGKVYIVSNTDDSGPGSLRECVSADGPRTCVFSTGGIIDLKDGLQIENDDITIAGQTAPGGGILLRNDMSVNNSEAPLKIYASNVVVRYITVRADPGERGDDTGSGLDGIQIGRRGGEFRDIVLDHISISWATDELFSSWRDSQQITLQWSVFAEGPYKSTHEKVVSGSHGNHSRGPLFGNASGGRVSAHHNVFYRNLSRNPRMSTGKGLVNDIVNNYIAAYGFGVQFAESYGAEPHGNVVGNVFEHGSKNAVEMRHEPDNPDEGAGALIYIKDNIGGGRSAGDPEWKNAWVETTHGSGDKDTVNLKDDHRFRSLSRLEAPQVTTLDSNQVKEVVMSCSGNNQQLLASGEFRERRDQAETRILSDIRAGKRNYIDFPSDVGGFPSISAGTPYTDSDKDGMADEWELDHFDSLDSSDLNSSKQATQDSDQDGFTDLEEFLNGTNPTVAEAGCEGGTSVPTPTPTSTECANNANINRTSGVDILDFSILIYNFGLEVDPDTPSSPRIGFAHNDSDINCDGKVDILDFTQLILQFGTE